MASSFSDDLISAYLDGELSAQEQAMVEAALRDSAELRRLCDELRTLRTALQAIPDEPPPAGLAERVLRQAERRMLLGPESAPGTDDAVLQPQEDVATPASQSPAEPARRARSMWWSEHGRWVATCGASAAVLLLAVLILSNRSPQFVATHTDSGAAESGGAFDSGEPMGTAAEVDDASIASAAAAEPSMPEPSELTKQEEAATLELARTAGSSVPRPAASPSPRDERAEANHQSGASGQLASGMRSDSATTSPEPASPPLAPASADVSASESLGAAGGLGGGGAVMGRDEGPGNATPKGAPSRGGEPTRASFGVGGSNDWMFLPGSTAPPEQTMREFEQHQQLLVLVRMPPALQVTTAQAGSVPSTAARSTVDAPEGLNLQVEPDGLMAARLQAAFGARPDLQIRRDVAGTYVVEGQLEAVRASLDGLLSRRIDQVQVLAIAPPPTAETREASEPFEQPPGSVVPGVQRCAMALDDAQRSRFKRSPEADKATRESASLGESVRTPQEPLDRVAAKDKQKELALPDGRTNSELVVQLLFRVAPGQPIMPAETAQQPEAAVSGERATPGNSAPPADPPPAGRSDK